MKLYFAIIFIAIYSALGFGQVAEFSFKKSVHKFPKTNEGVILTHYYVFKNKGKAPLQIQSYSVGCHCTKVEFPEYPILPGQTDSIKMIFDSNGKYGQQNRSIIISSNAKRKETILDFEVFVIAKNKQKK
jgi:hypothetical protein